MFVDPKPETLGMAAFGIAAALIDSLVGRGVLNPSDARAIYEGAQGRIHDRIGIAGSDAIALIGDLLGALG
jgi:hypothetical protein